MKKLGQEPAFPMVNSEGFPGNLDIIIADNFATGMSKRFYAACAAMQGFCANQQWAKTFTKDDWDEYQIRLVDASYKLADELLKQENEP